MMTIKDVRELIDFKLEGTGYMRAGGGRNSKLIQHTKRSTRKDYRVFKIYVIKLSAEEITDDDYTAVENLLNGIVWFYSGRKYMTQFERNTAHSHGLVMQFKWKIAL